MMLCCKTCPSYEKYKFPGLVGNLENKQRAKDSVKFERRVSAGFLETHFTVVSNDETLYSGSTL